MELAVRGVRAKSSAAGQMMKEAEGWLVSRRGGKGSHPACQMHPAHWDSNIQEARKTPFPWVEQEPSRSTQLCHTGLSLLG